MTRAVEGIEGDLYVTRWSRGGIKSKYKNYLDKNLTLVRQVDDQGNEDRVPKQKFLDFPLFVGKKWDFSFYARPAGDPTLVERKFYNDMEVVGYEEVVVPAGKFKAFKIKQTQTMMGGPRIWEGIRYHWYSPEVGFFIKSKSETVTRGWRDYGLISFELK